MTLLMDRNRHAILALLFLIALFFVFYLVLIAPALTRHREFKANLDDLQLQYARYTQYINQLGDLEKEVELLRQNLPTYSGFLEEKQIPLAAADLQRLINSIITSNAGEVVSTQMISEPDPAGLYPDITIRVTMRAATEALQQILYQIKSSDTLLVLDKLQIQTVNSGRRRRLGREEDLSQVEVQFDVTAFVYRAGGT